MPKKSAVCLDFRCFFDISFYFFDCREIHEHVNADGKYPAYRVHYINHFYRRVEKIESVKPHYTEKTASRQTDYHRRGRLPQTSHAVTHYVHYAAGEISRSQNIQP